MAGWGGERRRQVTIVRCSKRRAKNAIFTFVIMAQVTFWVYMLFTTATRAVLVDRRTLPLTTGNEQINNNINNINNVINHNDNINNAIQTTPLAQPAQILIKPNPTVLGQWGILVNENKAVINVPQPLPPQPQPQQPQPQPQSQKQIREMFLPVKEESEIKHTVVQQLEDSDYNKYFKPILHHTLLYRNASVIWTSPFLKNPPSICSRHRDLDLIIIVHSAPYNFRRRQMLRHQLETQHVYNFPYTIQLAFMIGVSGGDDRNASKETMIEIESSTHSDLVRMNFTENFRNLSLKASMWMRWTNENCKNAKMILKIDDDVVIDIQRILPMSVGVFEKYKRSIFCHLNKIGSQPIPRIGRTQVDPREFMRLAFYPYNYCSGFIVFLTPDLIPVLERTARRIPFYNVDDVFMFGMVPKLAGQITFHNIGYNVSIWNPKVYACNLRLGSQCPFFGTMGVEEEDRQRVWDVMRNNHAREFKFPQLHIG